MLVSRAFPTARFLDDNINNSVINPSPPWSNLPMGMGLDSLVLLRGLVI
jgi:hypothetical protein